MENILAEICGELHNLNLNIIELTKAIKSEGDDSVIKIDDNNNIVASGPNIQPLYGCPVNINDITVPSPVIKITEHKYSVVRRNPSNKNLFVLSPIRIKYNPGCAGDPINIKVKNIEEGFGLGGLWNDTLGVFDLDCPDLKKDIEYYGSFDNYLRINWIDTRKIWHQELENDILSTDEIMNLLEEE